MNTDPLWKKVCRGGPLAGHPIRYFPMIASTNSLAMELAKDGLAAGTVLVAECQSDGRGRLARSWVSPAGSGLYFSLLIRPSLPYEELPRLSLVAGLALCRALTATFPLRPGLKWPNDLLLDGKKCAGILVEAQAGLIGEAPVVIGIGLNVSTPATAFSGALAGRATSLAAALGFAPSRGLLLQKILLELDLQFARLIAGDFAGILAEWRENDIFADRELTWVNPQGGLVCGVSLGPNAEGLLRIRDRQGLVHLVISGDVGLVESFKTAIDLGVVGG